MADAVSVYVAKLRFGVSTIAFALAAGAVLWVSNCAIRTCAERKALLILLGAAASGAAIGALHPFGVNSVVEAAKRSLGPLSNIPVLGEVLAWMGISAITCVCSLLTYGALRAGTAEALRLRTRWLGLLLIAAATLLVLGVIQIDSLYRVAEASADSNSGCVMRLRNGVVTAAGGFYSMLLAVIFVPSFAILSSLMDVRVEDEARRRPTASLVEIRNLLRFDDPYGSPARILLIALLPLFSAMASHLFERAF